MFTALTLTLIAIALSVTFLGVIVIGVLKLAFKLVGLMLGFVLMFAGGALMFALGVGIVLALLLPLLPLLALVALIWLIVAATRPSPRPALTYAPRH